MPVIRCALYARYSSENQRDSYSIEAQLKECYRLAQERGWLVVHVYVDEAESAKSTNRPNFQELLRNAKFGKFDVIVVHKLDRFTRSLIDLLLTLRDLDRVNVRLVSAVEDFDFTTFQGKIMMLLIVLLAEWFLNNLRGEVEKGKKARAEDGHYNGAIPPGYTAHHKKDGGDGIPIPDEEEAAGVQYAYEIYATGRYSDIRVAELLNQAGLGGSPAGEVRIPCGLGTLYGTH